jgi:hypothetical protein
MQIHCKKRLTIFPSPAAPAGMSLTKLFLEGNNLIFPVPSRESLVSDIPAGDGKMANLFYSVTIGRSMMGREKGGEREKGG